MKIALLLESTDQRDMAAVRRLLKRLLRCYGLRCLAIRPPEETATFAARESVLDQNLEPEKPVKRTAKATRTNRKTRVSAHIPAQKKAIR